MRCVSSKNKYSVRVPGEFKTKFDLLTEADEIISDFSPKKEQSRLLAQSYLRQGFDDKYFAVHNCGKNLVFAHEMNADGSVDAKGKLQSGMFCRDRLCPICNRRRALRLYSQVSSITDYIQRSVPGKYKFVLLTLTVPNCSPDMLNGCIDDLMSSFSRLIRSAKFNRAVLGFVRVLEITINHDNGSFHPHFHILLCVPHDYADKTSDIYINHAEWLKMWRRAAKNENIQSLDVRFCRSKDGNIFDLKDACAEVCKYAVKSNDFIFPGDEKRTDDTIFALSSALSDRRLVSFGGLFQEARAALALSDAENGDLVHINEDDVTSPGEYLCIRYTWNFNDNIYVISEVYKKRVVDGNIDILCNDEKNTS